MSSGMSIFGIATVWGQFMLAGSQTAAAVTVAAAAAAKGPCTWDTSCM